MKRHIIFMLVLALFVSISYAGNFAPNKMILDAPQYVQYNFDGSIMNIPVSVSGARGTAILAIYTKDQAASIKQVTNGFLGWHYVNKIDTSIYISKPYQIALGSNTITWDGKDENGVTVTPGTFTYMIFAYDSVNNKIPVNRSFYIGGDVTILEKGTDGKPLANPLMFNRGNRWVIGNDPLDNGLTETCSFPTPSGWSICGRINAVDPTDFKQVYHEVANKESSIQGIAKYLWVPNGTGELQTTWADNGMATFHAPLDNEPGVVTDGKYLYTGDSNHHLKEADSDFYIYDFDGELVKTIDLTPWWSNPDNFANQGQMNGGPNFFSEKYGHVFLDCHCSCIKQMVDPIAALEDENDFIVWTNQNGDYFLDHNTESTSSKAWVCNDFNVPPEVYKVDMDGVGFVAAMVNYIGAVSFGLLGPDGTGAGYFAYAGETSNRWQGIEIGGTMFVQSGSAFDGIYVDNLTNSDSTLVNGSWYIAHDSVKGVISKQIGVAGAAPGIFVVAQNTPNPFNPSTAIKFTLPAAGTVRIDVFNSAGQRVERIADTHMSAGNHSVTWNASKHAAGVYYATVTAEGSSKTLKMTLLK